MRLSPTQKQVSDCPARFRVVCAGRRWGKTWLSLNDQARFARHPNQRVLYVAPTYKLAKSVMWEELKSQLYSRRWVKKVNESELTIWLINGSIICLRSAENRDALRGGKWDFIVLDEFQDIHPDTWTKVLRPTLSDRQGHALFIGTPKGMGTYFYDLWCEAHHRPDWSAHQFTTLQGGNVSAEEIAAARRDLDEKTFRQEYEASFESFTGQVFYNYDDVLNVRQTPPDLYDERTPMYVSCDFNRNPITAGIAVKHAQGFHYIDEIHIYGSNTYELVEEIRNRYGNRPYFAYPDATGARGSTNSKTSDHIILQQNGFRIQAGKTNPSISDSIASVNALLKNGDGERKLTFDPQCRNIRQSLLKYVYKEGTRIPLKDDVHDHHCDHIRYLVHGVFPMNRVNSQGKVSRYRTL